MRALILLSLAARIVPLAQTPELSHDAYRYLWDGRVAAEGINPYLHAPADSALHRLREPWHAKINHPEIRSIYPPAAQGTFAIVAFVKGGLWGWKGLLVAADLATIFMIALLAGRRVALLYALFPLVIFEGVWSAHIDLLSSCALLAALLALRRGKHLGSGVAMGVAVMLKVVPLAALPSLIAASSRRARLVAGFTTTSLLLVVPFAGAPLMPGMRDYATRWSFNSPVYASTLHLVERSRFPLLLKDVWTVIKDMAGLEAIAATVYGLMSAEIITRVLLAGILAVVLTLTARARRDVEWAIATSIGLLLLLSPTVHPWYWLAVLPFAMMARSVFWIALAAAGPLSYALYEGADSMLVFALCYGIPAVVTLAARMRDGSRAWTAGAPKPEPYFSSTES